MVEIWKAIEGYEGIYEVSTQGRVRSIKRGRLMALVKVAHGYTAVTLNKEGKSRMFLVHRLVAKAFIPNPENKEQVNHKDLIKSHNSVDNLEWMTQWENLTHAFENVPASVRNPRKCRTPESNSNYTANLWKSNLEAIRVGKGLSQEELAEKSCVKLDTIIKLENGDKVFRDVSVNTVCKLAWVLGVRFESLFDYDVEESIKRETDWHKNAKKKTIKKEI